MKRVLALLLLFLPGVLCAQGFSAQALANTAREYSVGGVTLPAFSVSAGFQPGRHWYFGALAGDGYDDTETGVERKYGLAGEVRYYLTKGYYWGGALGVMTKPGYGTVGPAWSLTLLGTREALGHGFYLATELSVGNIAPGMSFGLGYCPEYRKKRDDKPFDRYWEVEAGFPFFAYAGYRPGRNFGIGATVESFRKKVRLDGERIPCAYTCTGLQVRFYYMVFSKFELYSATGGGIAMLTPDDGDTRRNWYWDNTLIGAHARLGGGRFYVLGELKSGSLAWSGHIGVGVRL